MRAVVGCASGPGEVNETEGWGECTALPEPTFSAEYTAGAVEVSERYMVPALLQAGCARAEDVVPVLSFLKGHRMAKAAFEAALLDAQLKWAGVRLADHLASVSRTRQSPRPTVRGGRGGGPDQLAR